MITTDLLGALADAPVDEYPSVEDAPLRASWAGKCARQVHYYLTNEPASGDLDPQTVIAFSIGHAVHLTVQSAMQRLYPLGEPEAEGRLAVWLDPDNGESVIFPLKAGTPALETVPVIGCHADFWRPADFWCPATVTEVKTMQPYAWDKAQDEGPQLHHVLQAGLCALALEAGAIELVYIDKAKGRVAVFAVPDGWQALASTEASRLARLWPVGTIPEPMDYRRSVWQCKFCPWLTTCKRSSRLLPE